MRRMFTGLLAFALVLSLLAAVPAQAKVYKMSPEERAAALKEKRAKRVKAKKAGKAAPGQDQGGWVEVKPGERIAKKRRMSKVDEIAKAAEEKGSKASKKKSRRSKKNAVESAPENVEKSRKTDKGDTIEKTEKSGKKSKRSKKNVEEAAPEKVEKSGKADKSDTIEKTGKQSKSKRSKKRALEAESEKAGKTGKKSRKAKKDGGEGIVVEKKGYKSKAAKSEKAEQAAADQETSKADKSSRGRKSSRKSRRSATQGDRVVGSNFSDERKVPASSTEVHRTVPTPAAHPAANAANATTTTGARKTTPADDLSGYSVSRPGHEKAVTVPEVRQQVQPGPIDNARPVGSEGAGKAGEGRF